MRYAFPQDVSAAARMEELLHLLDEAWCCLVCYEKFDAGSIAPSTFCCPHCRSPEIHPIYRPPIILDQYGGAIGPRN